jgi:type I restriction enzyme S subunit
MELRKGYKQTEIGVIPNEWNLNVFGEIVNYIKGYPFKSKDYKADGIRIIRVSDTTFDSIKKDNCIYVDERRINEFRNWKLEKSDLIFSTVGSKPPMYDSMVGKAILIKKEFADNLLNQNAVLIRAKDKSEPIQELLLNHFRTKRYLQHIEGIYRGNANQASITLVDLFNFKIPLPSTKAEQTAIANALSDADALISSLEKLIKKKRNIKQGAMQELLKPKKGWVVKKLGDFLDYEQPTDYLVRDTEYNDFNQTPVLTAGKTFILGYTNEEEGIFKKLPVIIFDDFTTTIKYVDFPFKAKSSAMKMLIPKTENVNLRFVFELMLQIKYLPGDHKRHWIGEYRQMEIMVPASENEQNEIATILSDMGNEITSLEKKLSKSKMLKQGMMQELLTGKIRLV